MSALVSACSHHGSGGIVPPASVGSSNPLSALSRARQLDPTLCTFTAAGSLNADLLAAGTVAWFNSSLIASGTGPVDANIYITHSKVTFTTKDDGMTSVNVPDSTITLSPYALSGSVVFHDAINAWHVTAPTGVPGSLFANGGRLPIGDRLGRAKNATWSAIISSDTPGLMLKLHWAAQSYTTLGDDYNGMGVKPMDSATSTIYANDDFAGTPENYKDSLALGAGDGKQNGPSDRWTGHMSPEYSLAPCSLTDPGAGPTPTPVSTPIPPGSTAGPSPGPGGATSTPSPAPVAEPTHAAFVPNSADNNVSVINTGTHKAVGTIPVGANPYGVAINPAGTSVYVGNQWDSSVSVINALTGQVTGTIALDPAMGFAQIPYGIAFSPSGTRAYVAANDNNYGGSIAIIDPATSTEIGQIVAPGYGAGLPFDPIVSPDGNTLYVTELGSASIFAYATSSSTYLYSFVLSGGDPNGLAISPDGQTVYACNGGGLSYLNTVTRTELAFQSLSGGCADVVLSSTGATAYVSNNAGATVSVLNTSTRAAIATIKVGLGPHGISMSPSGTEVYVANTSSNSISVISTSTNTVTYTIAVGAQPYALGNFLK